MCVITRKPSTLAAAAISIKPRISCGFPFFLSVEWDFS
jgi:hypothetical protein